MHPVFMKMMILVVHLCFFVPVVCSAILEYHFLKFMILGSWACKFFNRYRMPLLQLIDSIITLIFIFWCKSTGVTICMYVRMCKNCNYLPLLFWKKPEVCDIHLTQVNFDEINVSSFSEVHESKLNEACFVGAKLIQWR